VSGLVRKRTAQLQNALVREKAQQAEAELAQARFARLQRIGIVGQMSSMIAHELRQPLATISMYCYGLLRRFENGTASTEVTVASLEKMAAQTQRASAIVDQVRLYARGNRERSPQDVVALTKAVLSDITKTQRDVTLSWETVFPDEPLWVEASALEIELMVQNVLKNAVAAALETPNKQAVIQLTVREEPGHAIITVANSGRILDEATWDNITQSSMPTTKDAGLGLGLSIVRSVTEDLGGRLQFHRPEMGGLICEIRLVTTKERP
jgi:two-component system sensor histidine kinase TtrS